jgi:myo-inositol-1(or 4)-monophosphatase
MDLAILTKQVANLSKAVGNFIKGELNSLKKEDIETKSMNSLVTYVDKNAEKMIVSELKVLLPEAGFITEEDSSLEKAEVYNWVIDPLDGTTNFIHGLPPFSVSIALIKDNEPLIGVVYEINLDE